MVGRYPMTVKMGKKMSRPKINVPNKVHKDPVLHFNVINKWVFNRFESVRCEKVRPEGLANCVLKIYRHQVWTLCTSLNIQSGNIFELLFLWEWLYFLWNCRKWWLYLSVIKEETSHQSKAGSIACYCDVFMQSAEVQIAFLINRQLQWATTVWAHVRKGNANGNGWQYESKQAWWYDVNARSTNKI